MAFVRVINSWIISSPVAFTVKNWVFSGPMQFFITSAAYHKGEVGISPIYPNKEIKDLTSKKTILLVEHKQLKVKEYKWKTKCHNFLAVPCIADEKFSFFFLLSLPVNFIPVKILFELHIWNTIIIIELESCWTGFTCKWWFQMVLEPVKHL